MNKFSRRARRLARVFVLSLVAAAPALQCLGGLLEEPKCPSSSQQIITDRPDISTAVTVVPERSLQISSGLAWTAGQGSQTLDGPQTELRAGVAHCTEAILDLPNYTSGVTGTATSGFSPVELSVKRQMFRLPGSANISAVLGVGLPVANHTGSCNGYETFAPDPLEEGTQGELVG